MALWKSIPEFENYIVSDEGIVLNVRGKVVKPYKSGFKYLYLAVDLYRGGKRKKIRLNRLVASLFVENETAGNEVNHIDRDYQNNNAWNLEWCTRVYNENYKKGRKQYVFLSR